MLLRRYSLDKWEALEYLTLKAMMKWDTYHVGQWLIANIVISAWNGDTGLEHQYQNWSIFIDPLSANIFPLM